MSETDPDEIIFKDYDNNAQAPAATSETVDWSPWERWLRAHLSIERRGLLDALEQDVLNLVDQLRAEWRREIEREIGTLRNENAELKGMLGGVLAVLSTKAVIHQGGEVLDLPKNFLRRNRVA